MKKTAYAALCILFLGAMTWSSGCSSDGGQQNTGQPKAENKVEASKQESGTPNKSERSTSTAANADANRTAPKGKVIVTVIVNGKETKTFDMDGLNSLERITITAMTRTGPKPQTGPAVGTVLKSAGVAAAKSIEIVGVDSRLTLTPEQVDKSVLAFTNRDTFKFASPDIPSDRWPKDVLQVIATE